MVRGLIKDQKIRACQECPTDGKAFAQASGEEAHHLCAVYHLGPTEQGVHPGVALGLVQIKGFGRLFQVKKTGLIFNKAVILRDKTSLLSHRQFSAG